MSGSVSALKFISYNEAFGQPFDDMLIRVPDLTKAQRLIGYQRSFRSKIRCARSLIAKRPETHNPRLYGQLTARF